MQCPKRHSVQYSDWLTDWLAKLNAINLQKELIFNITIWLDPARTPTAILLFLCRQSDSNETRNDFPRNIGNI